MASEKFVPPMEKEWLAEALAEIGVKAGKWRNEIVGHLVGIKGRREWSFKGGEDATVEDLKSELAKQMKEEKIEIAEENGRRILEIKEEIGIVVGDKQFLYLEIEEIKMHPVTGEEAPIGEAGSGNIAQLVDGSGLEGEKSAENSQEEKGKSSLDRIDSTDTDRTESGDIDRKEDMNSYNLGRKITLLPIGIKKRTCQLCRIGISKYKRKMDVLICTKEKGLCEQCYREFHWDKKGERKYEEFSYEMKE